MAQCRIPDRAEWSQWVLLSCPQQADYRGMAWPRFLFSLRRCTYNSRIDRYEAYYRSRFESRSAIGSQSAMFVMTDPSSYGEVQSWLRNSAERVVVRSVRCASNDSSVRLPWRAWPITGTIPIGIGIVEVRKIKALFDPPDLFPAVTVLCKKPSGDPPIFHFERRCDQIHLLGFAPIFQPEIY